MKLRNSTIVKACFVFFVLSSYSMFYLIKIPGVTHYNYSITAAVGIGLSLIMLFSKQEYTWNKISTLYRIYLLSTVVSVLFLSFFTIVRYNGQPLTDTFRVMGQYLLVIWAIPIVYLFNNSKSEYPVLDIINLVSLIWCIMAIAHAIYYRMSGGILFQNIEEVNTGVRNELSRIPVGSFANFSILYSFYRFYSAKDGNKLFFLVSMLILGAANIFVLQSRAATVAVVLSIAAMFFFDNTKKYSFYFKLIVICVGGLFIVFTGVIQKYLETEYHKYNISVYAREYAFNYYFSIFLKNPLVGFGFVKSIGYESIIRGPRGIASIDDVGFVGQLAVLGIFAVAIIVLAYFYLFKQVLEVKKFSGSFNPLMIGVLVYILATSITFIVFDQQRIALLPVAIALFEFYTQKARDAIRLNV